MPAIVPSMGTRVSLDLTPPAVFDAVRAPMVAPGPDAGPRQKLLDRVRHAIRTRHYSRRTEQAYVDWIRRYIAFHRMTHPAQMGASHVSQFLTWLAVDRQVSASTQNQALSALLFLVQARPRDRDHGDSTCCAHPHARTIASGAQPGGDRRDSEAAHRHAATNRHGAVRVGGQAGGVSRSAGQGPRFRSAPDHRAAGKGPKGSGDDAAGGGEGGVDRALG
jgi:hypothetical protein